MPPNAKDAELRGWAARHMVAQDSRWAVDMILSGRLAPPLDSFVPLLLGHHFVRIAYEGTRTLQSTDPDVGIPEFAELLSHTFADITARVRHATKLLDDTKKTFVDVIDDFDAIARAHRDEFLGNTHRLLRWLETDLGIFSLNGSPVGATIPIAYRLAFERFPSGEQLHAVAEEWGGALSVLNAAALDADEQQATLDLLPLASIADRDVRSDRYLARRYEADFPDGLKLLLLAVETDINALLAVGRVNATAHEDAVFRLNVVTAFHALSTLRQVADLYAELHTPGMARLRDVLDSGLAAWLLSKPGRAVRNRCMHYPVRESDLALDPALPMFGIVPAVSGRDHAAVVADVSGTLEQIADLFGQWNR